jgi:para-aminobenzoate synthetase component 1
MRALIERIVQSHSAESLVQRLHGEQGVTLLRSSSSGTPQPRYSFVAARPFLTFRAAGSRCELRRNSAQEVIFGDPWRILEALMARYELTEQMDLPFPLGGCFGFWGYDLKNFLEPALPRRAINDLEFPDCHLGFYDSVVALDHELGATWILATGIDDDGSRCASRAKQQRDFWLERLEHRGTSRLDFEESNPDHGRGAPLLIEVRDHSSSWRLEGLEASTEVWANLSRAEYLARVEQAQRYISSGDIYQVNLAQRLTSAFPFSAWRLFQVLSDVSPASFSAYYDAGDFQIVSSSPELFLRMSGSHIQTRPIKGTRPRSADSTRDSQLSYELQTSPKELAELVMITDLLRNDLGRVCEFGTIQVPDLARLERYAHVQHLVSTIEGILRPDLTHLSALAACFPGGSITGAPKFRAMQVIDELEPVCRGPYTGAMGYLGFNGESQLSMMIRTALCKQGMAHFHVGAGIVADSVPEAEYHETLHKAQGFFEALRHCWHSYDRIFQRKVPS